MKILQTTRSSAAIGSTFGGTSRAGEYAAGVASYPAGKSIRILRIAAQQASSAASTQWLELHYGDSSNTVTSMALMPCGSSVWGSEWNVDIKCNWFDFISGSSEIAVQVYGN